MAVQTQEIDRDLLWKAWPDGQLPMRGVYSVAGWLCCGVRPGRSLWLPFVDCSEVRELPLGGPPFERRAAWRPNMDIIRTAAELGDLLPHVNRNDPATWACLVHDLVTAALLGFAVHNYAFMRLNSPGLGCPGYWSIVSDGGPFSFRDIDRTLDVETALVLARIHLRELS